MRWIRHCANGLGCIEGAARIRRPSSPVMADLQVQGLEYRSSALLNSGMGDRFSKLGCLLPISWGYCCHNDLFIGAVSRAARRYGTYKGPKRMNAMGRLVDFAPARDDLGGRHFCAPHVRCSSCRQVLRDIARCTVTGRFPAITRARQRFARWGAYACSLPRRRSNSGREPYHLLLAQDRGRATAQLRSAHRYNSAPSAQDMESDAL